MFSLASHAPLNTPTGGWNTPLDGFGVTDDFNLPAPYYPFMLLAECRALCDATPTCRSFSYRVVSKQCRLKAATCAEAGIGRGCVLIKPNQNLHIHADKSSKSWRGSFEGPGEA